MSIAARLIVWFVFFTLGASFLATTASLMIEFKDQVWLDLLTTYSHLFAFFPTLGIVALVAFYVPSAVFVDLYWKHLKFGKARFFFGFLVVGVASYLISLQIIDNPRRGVWEMAPDALVADRGEPENCVRQGLCQRMPVLAALQNLRKVSGQRIGLEAFARDCALGKTDPLFEKTSASEPKRVCFASTPLSAKPILQTNEECCKAQRNLFEWIWRNYFNPNTRSITSRVHEALLPLKVFFFIILFLIGIMLSVHYEKVEEQYGHLLPHIEIGLVIGSVSALFFPLMSQAFLLSTDALSGSEGRGKFAAIAPFISFLFMVWTLLIALFFHRRGLDGKVVTLGRFMGLLASNIGIIKYSLIVSLFAWALGVGASILSLLALCAFTLALLVGTLWLQWRAGRDEEAEAAPPAGMALPGQKVIPR